MVTSASFCLDGPGRRASGATALHAMTDEHLLKGYRGGNRDNFAELVHRYHRELYHFLVRFLGDPDAAEDVFQDTFLQIHQSAAQFDPKRRFRPWLFAIAANKARDHLRTEARRPTVPLEASIRAGEEDSGKFVQLIEHAVDVPVAPLEKEELRQRVHDVVVAMPEHLREILLLAYFHRFPYKQIASILDIPLGTVKSRLHAAFAAFASRWCAIEASDPAHHQRRTQVDDPPQRTAGAAAAVDPPPDLVHRTLAQLAA